MDCDVTYDELAAFVCGDLDAGRDAEIREHLPCCGRCRKRLEALGRADAALAALPPFEPAASILLATRRALAEVTRGPGAPEIMTLEEVAEFLRLSPAQLGEVVEELPAFELGGQIRVRRARLIEWIRQRERDYTRQATAAWVARAGRSAPEKGVA